MSRTLHLAGQPLPVVGRLRVYVCGITPYDVTHLGHAATFVWTDALVRVVRSQGTAVELTRNVTDVDEALLAEAARRGQLYEHLASLQRFEFDRTMTSLRVRPPEHEPTARGAVAEVIRLTEVLLERGAAYLVGATVYAQAAAAAARSGLAEAAAGLLAQEYGEDLHAPGKQHPLDVVLWRETGPGAVSWPSPWGPGRPGWHAECAAMVLTQYGSSVDLHIGGVDLRYPHHACEALLAETATGVTPFARAWMHVGTVGIDGAKMAKSTGNLVLVDDLLEHSTPAAIRLLLLNRAWHQGWDYTPQALREAEALLEQVYAAAARPGGEAGVDTVDAALLADLDVPAALSAALQGGGAAARRLVEVLALG
jgi:cysteinyl-tRNA synthetase